MRHRKGERGATLVEAAFIAPVLFLVIFAFLDIGMYTRSLEMASNSVITGSRTARASATDPAADYYILKSIKDSLTGVSAGNIDCVIVFHALKETDTVSDCSSSTCPAACNYYAGSFVDALPSSSSFTGTAGDFTGTSDDSAWPAVTRDVSRHCGTDLLGVYLQMKYTSITGMYKFPGTIRKNFVAPLDALTDDDFGADDTPNNQAC